MNRRKQAEAVVKMVKDSLTVEPHEDRYNCATCDNCGWDSSWCDKKKSWRFLRVLERIKKAVKNDRAY
jgi:hypothetical protein